MDRDETLDDAGKRAGRAVWRKPEVHRLSLGETASTVNNSGADSPLHYS